MALKFEIYKNNSGVFRWRPIRKAKASLNSSINPIKGNLPGAAIHLKVSENVEI